MTSQAPGFAAATQPVAQTRVHTDSQGLAAGDVKLRVADGELSAYRAMPDGARGLPIVLVVQEIFGLHEYVKDVCRRFSKHGYLAVACEHYERQGDVSKLATVEEIRPIVARVPDAQVLSDLDAARDFAVGEGGDATRLGITGFCWGGRVVWLYAAHNPALKAGVAWYGRLEGPASEMQPEQPIEVVARIDAPVLGLYGGADAGIPNDSVDRMRAALQAAGKPSGIHLYPDAPHAFHADYRPSYRPDAARDGWERTLAWLARHGVA